MTAIRIQLKRSRIGVRQAAQAAGSMTALAAILGVHRSTVYRWRPLVPKKYEPQLREALPDL